jgi:hypothetical protein
MAEGYNKTRVVIFTGSYRIKGDIDIVAGARVTDYMIETKKYFAVTNAEVWDLEGRKIHTAPFVNVNSAHVVVVAPE